MTAQTVPQRTTTAEAIGSGTDRVAAAREYVEATALRSDDRGRIGLELELHLVDLAHPARRPAWSEVEGLLADLAALPGGSRVSVEPGGQLELSTNPQPDAESAIRTLADDCAAMREVLTAAGYGAAALGADPARRLRRVNPNPRYAAMERHFAARGYARPGAAMMTATAALQINLDAGPPGAWAGRMALLRVLTPLLTAISANSPYLGGSTSGWRSMREQSWLGVDRRRSDPIPAGPPAAAWADYALAAPVMLVRSGAGFHAVTERVRLREWLADPRRVGRVADLSDVDYHLTTLFPPVRPKGWLELRMIDALPDPWWRVPVAVAAAWIDDAEVVEAAAATAGRWLEAARCGLADPLLGPLAAWAAGRAVGGLDRVGADPCTASLTEQWADRVTDGKSLPWT